MFVSVGEYGGGFFDWRGPSRLLSLVSEDLKLMMRREELFGEEEARIRNAQHGCGRHS